MQTLEDLVRGVQDVLRGEPQDGQALRGEREITSMVLDLLGPRGVVGATVTLNHQPPVEEEIDVSHALVVHLKVDYTTEPPRHQPDECLRSGLRPSIHERPQDLVAPRKMTEDQLEVALGDEPSVERAVNRGDRMRSRLAPDGVGNGIQHGYHALRWRGREQPLPVERDLRASMTRWEGTTPRARGAHAARSASHPNMETRPIVNEYPEEHEEGDAVEPSPDAHRLDHRGRGLCGEVVVLTGAHQPMITHCLGDGTRGPSLRAEL